MSFLFWRRKVDPAKPGHIVDLGGMNRPYEVMSPERFVYVLQHDTQGVRNARMEGIRQVKNNDVKMRTVFEMIAAGAEIPETQLPYLIREDGDNRVAWDNCLDSGWFADSDRLTPTMVAVAAFFAANGKPYGMSRLPENALGQLMRQAVEGRLDSDRLEYLWQVGEANRDTQLSALYAVHTSDPNPRVNYHQPYVPNSLINLESEDFLRRTYDEAAHLHGVMFMQHWLPAQISEAEYAEARELSTEVLRQLYAPIWDGGYVAYREALLSQAEATLATH